MMVHLVAGHDLVRDPGAISKHPILGDLRESKLTVEYRGILKRELDFLKIPNSVDNDNDTLQTVVNKLRSTVKPEDIVIDIHFNAVSNPQAHGTETFVKNKPSEKDWFLGKGINDIMYQTMGTRNRGVKTESQSARGKLAIMSLPCTVILLEIGFITNTEDMNRYTKWKHILGSRHADFLYEFIKDKK